MSSSTQSDSLARHRESGAAATQRIKLYETIIESKAITRAGLSQATGFSLQSVCGRVGELKEAGLVADADFTTTDPITFRKVRPVIAIFKD